MTASDAQIAAFLDALTPDQKSALMRDMVRQKLRHDADTELARYHTPDGIVAFAHEVLKIKLTAYQERILRALVTYKRVAVRGPHGLGKTTLAAVVVLWAVCVF